MYLENVAKCSEESRFADFLTQYLNETAGAEDKMPEHCLVIPNKLDYVSLSPTRSEYLLNLNSAEVKLRIEIDRFKMFSAKRFIKYMSQFSRTRSAYSKLSNEGTSASQFSSETRFKLKVVTHTNHKDSLNFLKKIKSKKVLEVKLVYGPEEKFILPDCFSEFIRSQPNLRELTLVGNFSKMPELPLVGPVRVLQSPPLSMELDNL